MKRANIDSRRRWFTPALVVSCFILASNGLAAASWESTLTSDPPGNFPLLRPVRTTYRFGWSGLTAGTGDLHFTGPTDGRFQLEGTGKTIGLVRALWKLDAEHTAAADARALKPIEMEQTESYRKKKLVTHLTFSNSGVTRVRTEGPEGPKTKRYSFPNMFDLHSAVLYLRSQPLKNGSVYRLVVYPATTPYLATITVVGHEKTLVHAGSYDAIKLDLKLSKIGKNMELEPHKKFRRGTIWVSNDSDRLLLRIEAQIFVGTVFAELQSVDFDQPKS